MTVQTTEQLQKNITGVLLTIHWNQFKSNLPGTKLYEQNRQYTG
jgi:hypothetical protein